MRINMVLGVLPASGLCVSGRPPESERRIRLECRNVNPQWRVVVPPSLIPHRQCEDWIYQRPKPELTMR